MSVRWRDENKWWLYIWKLDLFSIKQIIGQRLQQDCMRWRWGETKESKLMKSFSRNTAGLLWIRMNNVTQQRAKPGFILRIKVRLFLWFWCSAAAFVSVTRFLELFFWVNTAADRRTSLQCGRAFTFCKNVLFSPFSNHSSIWNAAAVYRSS